MNIAVAVRSEEVQREPPPAVSSDDDSIEARLRSVEVPLSAESLAYLASAREGDGAWTGVSCPAIDEFMVD
ncbi:MAG: hypothetical protein COU33_01605 [Candidatus Magasanikbacteria bacterium CG10_big_fil_rev_8_21_14_0_10_43_6]|uniref:Uncharacterized protein n=1 Tax=Candidatus Magasanikbacteria bacterium CG10_big_fil_rev_8_21_14_0_10_43_6 TaxID=1974650 RepID=A0A2M6W1W2_9BACT|nr:MAG: hypothetical protein COU33_01605 [Candidatus Magasanikbacteria bacterium CG10_big_fil_rev_8_21_14_0_10_43_6]